MERQLDSKNVLDSKIQRESNITRETALQRRSDRKKSAPVPLMVTNDPILPSLGLTTRYQNIVYILEQLQTAFLLLKLFASIAR